MKQKEHGTKEQLSRESFLLGKIDELVKLRLRLTCEIEEYKTELAELERTIKEQTAKV